MNVGDLKKMLEKYPDDMEILNGRFSDYEVVSEHEWSVVNGVDNGNGWVMRGHPTMSQENKQKEKSYLALAGN
jgi:hypothetical protein